jgi:hypothetical protein
MIPGISCLIETARERAALIVAQQARVQRAVDAEEPPAGGPFAGAPGVTNAVPSGRGLRVVCRTRAEAPRPCPSRSSAEPLRPGGGEPECRHERGCRRGCPRTRHRFCDSVHRGGRVHAERILPVPGPGCSGYSSWRRHQMPVLLRPRGAWSSHWNMPQRASSPSHPRA